MDVVREDDGSGFGTCKDTLGDDLRARAFPVKRIDRPEDDLHPVLFFDGTVESGISCSVGRTHEGDGLAGSLGDFCGGVGQFVLQTPFAELVECFVVPAVVGDFMALGDGTSHDLGMLLDELTEDEEGGLDVALLEDVEQAWSEDGARAVIEGHGNDGTIDAHSSDVGPLTRLGRQLL